MEASFDMCSDDRYTFNILWSRNKPNLTSIRLEINHHTLEIYVNDLLIAEAPERLQRDYKEMEVTVKRV